MSTLPAPLPGQPNSGQPMMPGPESVQPAEPPLSEASRLLNTFVAPSKTFEDLRRNASWWVPWLVGAVFGLGFGIVAAQKIDFVRYAHEQIDKSPKAQQRMEQVPEGQRDQIIRVQATVTKVALYFTPVLSLIFGSILAVILWAVFSFGFGAEVGFGRSMAIVFYAYLPYCIRSALLSASYLMSSDPTSIDFANNPMPTNPAFFLDPQGNKLLYGLASGFDIFAIWVVILLGLGFAKASLNKKPSVNAALITMFVLYALVVLIGAGFKAAFS